ncbi:MAG: hypothetical protein JST04_12350 [Bdellovibrionales bacterium]|nr:hypothetical protein [Bdellovibrionales bacterium]
MKNLYSNKILKNALLAALGALTLAGLGYAAVSENYDVVVRKKNGGYEIASRPLEGLIARDAFETDHFRVVWKKEEETLTLDRIAQIAEETKTIHKDDPLWADRDADRIRLMAANVLYHAEAAHRFFTDRLASEDVKKLEKIVIRLDLTNKYSQFERFANDNYQPQYNNALSIEAGKPLKPRPGVGPWQREIWFRPEKKIPIGEILAQLPEDPANAQIREARAELYPMQIDLAFRNTLYAAFQSRLDSAGYIDSIVRQGGTMLLMEGAFQVLKVVNRVIIPQKFYLETAMVPEIIYHEFSHIALSDYMHPDLSTPVNEGMADFFAASVADSPKLAKKIRAYSTAVGKNGNKRQFFQMELETLGKAQSDYVLGLLWGLRDVLGEKPATNLIFGARKFLTTKDSDIRTGLVTALLRSCETACESPLRDRMLIHQYLQDRGL